jgi:cytochrome c biogenesis protein CcdA
VTLVLIGLIGGNITGLSPCVLPVLPVVLLGGGSAGADTGAGTGPDAEAARRRPYLVVLGLTLSFAVFTLFGSLILAMHDRVYVSPLSRRFRSAIMGTVKVVTHDKRVGGKRGVVPLTASQSFWASQKSAP